MSQAVLKEITHFYLQSADFNGIPLSALLARVGLPRPRLQQQLTELIEAGEISLAFGSIQSNPHIKMFPDLPTSQQTETLRHESLERICAYPSAVVLQAVVDETQYKDRPFTKRLALGEPQLLPLYFDLVVLETYYADPRYHFVFDDYDGSISISDKYYHSEDTAGKDKVVLQSFGLGYASNGDRVAVVYLRYLSDLSPEHQIVWSTHVRNDNCRMVDDYYRTSILGEWPEADSVYSAFLHEQFVINEMARLMGKPPLFRKTFEKSRPKEFSTFLRPTATNYESFIHVLDKLLADNINKKFFERDVPLEDRISRGDGTVEVRPRGTLSLLEDWLRMHFRLEEPTMLDEIMKPLREIRELRSSGPAHRIDEDVYDRDYYRKQDELMKRAYAALRSLRLVLAIHPKAKECEVPQWLQEGRIKFY